MTLIQDWFDVQEVEPGIFAIEEPLHVERVKSHLVVGTERAVLIDTGMGVGDIRAVVDDLTDLPVTVLLSHTHWDHVGGNTGFDEILVHPAEAEQLSKGFGNERLQRWFAPQQLIGPLPAGVTVETLSIPPSSATGDLVEGQTIYLGGRTLEVLHCPGHSPGGLVFLDRANGVLFSTDVAYRGNLYVYGGPTMTTYGHSLQRLAALAPDLRVLYPSHNDAVVEPGVLPRLATLLQQVINGREPDGIQGDVAGYIDGDVGIYLFPER